MKAQLILKEKHGKVVLQMKQDGKTIGEIGAIPLKDPEDKDNHVILHNRICDLFVKAVKESEEEWNNE